MEPSQGPRRSTPRSDSSGYKAWPEGVHRAAARKRAWSFVRCVWMTLCVLRGEAPQRALCVCVCGKGVYMEIYGYVGVYGCIWVWMYMEVWGYVYRCVYMGMYVGGCVGVYVHWGNGARRGSFPGRVSFLFLVSVLALKGLKCLPLFPYLSSLGLPPPGSLPGISSQPSPHTEPAVLSPCCPW